MEVVVVDPVGYAEIGERLGVRAKTVRVLRNRHADFPVPAVTVTGTPVWSWREVAVWDARRKGAVASDATGVLPDPASVAAFDANLAGATARQPDVGAADGPPGAADAPVPPARAQTKANPT